jgi:hypothetical protein
VIFGKGNSGVSPSNFLLISCIFVIQYNSCQLHIKYWWCAHENELLLLQNGWLSNTTLVFWIFHVQLLCVWFFLYILQIILIGYWFCYFFQLLGWCIIKWICSNLTQTSHFKIMGFEEFSCCFISCNAFFVKLSFG